MLRQDIERRVRDADGIEPAAAGQEHGGAGLHEIVHIRGHEHAVADGVDVMPGAAGALEGAAHALGRGEHDHEIDGADIDARAPGWSSRPRRAIRRA